MIHKTAAQLFTLREEMKRGIKPVLAELKQMGWPGVQLSALPEGYDPQELAAWLQEYNLKAAGMHVSLQRLEKDLEGVIEEVNLYQTKDIVCPFLPESTRTKEGYTEIKHKLNKWAKQASSYRISYHNHDFEFDVVMDEGQSALEYLLEPTPDNLIYAEIDVYWVKKAGLNPVSFIRPYAKRMPLLHLKDMTNDHRQTFAEIGQGQIDFLPIIEWGEQSGVEWYIVEQDQCERDPMRSLEMSLVYLNQMKV
ncbi:sugar phosphate isomerase/epimerase family protein [Alkalicoccobacillus porphyridii]|uniref:Sugar phosphate isomerase/epimerase n=1 Tax=Alkalicoccobacillus porphyridii TaxID=2597270 RepID=A0A554A307_9BACI|nr:sugar phosphate isomerase/epimerase [Alkalicoccobacillus porphyridii]TSB48081.1 sugar phosphate isomerase/epimerase [Alkalicoccobacillus porphyridii]